jgi:rRNA-processing protein FCF1
MKSYNVSSKKISARNADAALLNMAKSGYLVATNDRELKRRINLASEKVAYLRQKKYIEIG